MYSTVERAVVLFYGVRVTGGRCIFGIYILEKKLFQVFMSYGQKSNDELLQYFGFVEEENRADEYRSVEASSTAKIAGNYVSKIM